MSNTLQGKRIAVTGGARGIGRSIARVCAGAGAQVVIGDIDRDQVRATAAELVELTGGRIAGLELDVAESQSFEQFLDDAERELGGLDVLVNNAGIMPTGRFLHESLELADRQLTINLRGVIIGSKLAGRRFAAGHAGHIVNIASVLGLGAAPGVATYCATKFAVVGLGSALHQELSSDGVAVSTICPAFVNTELIGGLSPNRLMRRIGFIEPEDVAAAVAEVIARGRGGQRVVPVHSGIALRLLAVLPEGSRNRLSRLLGSHDTVTHADTGARAAYLDRVAGRKG
ncbi:SDR family NAD(P)-dependent oxidoreductase [Nocardia sp. NBC_01327]|uniref:SDR family NAD(P)-dependent oxidoreductase n=1 Tax=Nocardia sp. NBC_01327 TaxID=2903593 RepID=UPI002E119972|nr:SDR family NAD(P)-dependent oxidoreductase [Nocardia sp. NBC_01327]